VASSAELAELKQQLQQAASNAAILSQYHDKLFSTLGAEFVLAVKHIAALEVCLMKPLKVNPRLIPLHGDTSSSHSILALFTCHFLSTSERHHQCGRHAACAARLCAPRHGRTRVAAAHAAHGE
jgi:hypothetical protein